MIGSFFRYFWYIEGGVCMFYIIKWIFVDDLWNNVYFGVLFLGKFCVVLWYVGEIFVIVSLIVMDESCEVWWFMIYWIIFFF